MELRGPYGHRQFAPNLKSHQLAQLERSTACLGGLNTRDPAFSILGRAPGYDRGSGARSASVTYPVAFTNLRNCALVTGVGSIQNPLTRTEWIGASSE